jgi:hypothetical protein
VEAEDQVVKRPSNRTTKQRSEDPIAVVVSFFLGNASTVFARSLTLFFAVSFGSMMSFSYIPLFRDRKVMRRTWQAAGAAVLALVATWWLSLEHQLVNDLFSMILLLTLFPIGSVLSERQKFNKEQERLGSGGSA